jgi:hypothetical protein
MVSTVETIVTLKPWFQQLKPWFQSNYCLSRTFQVRSVIDVTGPPGSTLSAPEMAAVRGPCGLVLNQCAPVICVLKV